MTVVGRHATSVVYPGRYAGIEDFDQYGTGGHQMDGKNDCQSTHPIAAGECGDR
jgi:hypothetical protein